MAYNNKYNSLSRYLPDAIFFVDVVIISDGFVVCSGGVIGFETDDVVVSRTVFVALISGPINAKGECSCRSLNPFENRWKFVSLLGREN